MVAGKHKLSPFSILRERNCSLKVDADVAALEGSKKSPSRCMEAPCAFEQLPEELLRMVFTFADIEELLLSVTLISQKTRVIVVKLLDRKCAFSEKRLYLALDVLYLLRKRYDEMKSQGAGKVLVRTVIHELFVNCKSRFDRLVKTDDRELHSVLSMGLDRPTTFREYRRIIDVFQNLLESRQTYMKRFYCPSNDPSRKLILSELGEIASTKIFQYFDKDQDNRLNFTELRMLNDFAGVPLARETYEMTLRKFDSVAGALTLQGKSSPYLHICIFCFGITKEIPVCIYNVFRSILSQVTRKCFCTTSTLCQTSCSTTWWS